jgi:hypothetical protein
MSHLFWLTGEQGIRPLFPKPRVLDVPMNFGLLYRPCYPHWPALGGMLRPSPGHIRRCKIHCQVVGMGVFARIFRELAKPGTDGEIVMRRTRPTPHLSFSLPVR